MNDRTQPQEGNFLPGEITIDTISLVNQEREVVELKNITAQVDIFEGIDNAFLSGRVSIFDGVNFHRNYKVYGQESLTIKYRVKEDGTQFGKQAEKTFRIYKTSNVQNMPGYTTDSLAIHFIDPRYFQCEQKRISQTFRGSYSEILLKSLLKHGGFEQQTGSSPIEYWDKSYPENKQIVCGNWSLNRLIRYINENANYEENAGWRNSMFFYQAMHRGFRFMALDTMLSGNTEHAVSFSYRPKNAVMGQEETPNVSQGGHNSKILQFEYPHKGDTLAGVKTGTYSSSLRVFDPIRNIEKEIYYDMQETFDRNKDKHLSGFPLIRTEEYEDIYSVQEPVADDEYQANKIQSDTSLNQAYLIGGKTHYKVNNSNAYSDSPKLQDTSQYTGEEHTDNSFLEGIAARENLSQYTVKVTVPMRDDVSVGQVIHLELPRPEVGAEGEDLLNDNRYLVTKIRHSFSPGEFRGTMTMMCAKESFAKNLSEEFLPNE